MIIFYLWECDEVTCTTTESTKSPETLADCRTRKRPSLKPPSRRAYKYKYKNTMMDPEEPPCRKKTSPKGFKYKYTTTMKTKMSPLWNLLHPESTKMDQEELLLRPLLIRQKILIVTSSAPSRSKLSWKKFSRSPFSGVEGLDRLLGIRLVMLEVLAIWTSRVCSGCFQPLSEVSSHLRSGTTKRYDIVQQIIISLFSQTKVYNK